MMIDEENYLHDGVLIEVGKSKTDTKQHITIEELNSLCQQISEFRELVAPL
jgi:3-deoxy-D-arabino-heptulosonate 7-phosphate (DAHP) synthase